MAEIRLEGVSYYHGKGTPYEIKALDSIDLTIKSNIVTGIIGHTGSGKSTLVELFNGILKPSDGTVYLDGEDIWAKPKDIRKVRFRVGLVMQYPEAQLFEETIREDIAFGPKNMGLSAEEIAGRVLEAARFVGLDETLLDKSPFDLSGGQKRRAAIAGIIAMRPEVLILDEPAAGLDPEGRRDILGGIKRFSRSSGTTVIIVSHSMEDMAMYCDDIIVMSAARILMHRPCAEVFSEYRELIAVGLDVPQITRIADALSQYGIDIGRDIYTVDYAVEKIKEFMGGTPIIKPEAKQV